jgi:hypothetical protein
MGELPMTSLREKLSLTFWWGIACGITAYLFLGAVDTIMVIIQ